MRDPDFYTVVVGTIIGLLVGGLVGGGIVALAARLKQMAEGDRAGAAYRDLRDAAQRYADPVHEAALMRAAADIWDRWRPDGLMMDAFWRRDPNVELTPAYAHRLVDAIDTGDPVDLAGCWVPADIEGRLRVIKFGSSPVTGWPTQRGPSDG